MATERKAIKFRLRQMKQNLMFSEEHFVLTSSPSFKTSLAKSVTGEKSMRHSVALLTITAALFLVFASSTPVALAEAQPQSLLTRRVRDVTLNGQAPLGIAEPINSPPFFPSTALRGGRASFSCTRAEARILCLLPNNKENPK
jgi:hypothetical protein